MKKLTFLNPAVNAFKFLSILVILFPSYLVAQVPGNGKLSAQDIAKVSLPSVVMLVMTDEGKNSTRSGSGFFVTPDVIVTNYHLVEGTSGGFAKVVGRDESYGVIGVVAFDIANDLALVKLKNIQGPVLRLSSTDSVAIDDAVYAAGNSKGVEGSFLPGAVSGIRKLRSADLIQITAAISNGDNGGAILDANGEVIGVALVAIEDGQTLNFAIPVRYVRALLARISGASSTPRPDSTPKMAGDVSTSPSPVPFTAPTDNGAARAVVTEFDVNGMKVLIKRRPGTPTVAAGLFFRGGVRNLTAENAGIENFTMDAAIEGSKGYPREKLRKETSRIGTQIASDSNYDFSVLSLASTKQNFETSWQVFVDIAINPAFAPEDVDRVRENILTALRSETDSPEGSLEVANQNLIYKNHPYANDPDGTIENVTKFKAADLAAYHRKLLQTSRMLLVIVGDVEPAVMQKRIEDSFAKLPRGDYKDVPLPPLSFTQPTVDVISKPVQTDYVKGSFAAPSLGDPDYYAMRTAISILQANVFQEVRVKRNLSYAPDAEMDTNSASTGSISVSSVNPNESVRIMLGEIQKLKQGDMEPGTIGQMAGFFLTTYYLKQETNAAQAGELAQYELLGGGWRNSLEFLDRIRKVKPAEVQAAANKYMKNLRFVVVGNPADIDRSIFLQK